MKRFTLGVVVASILLAGGALVGSAQAMECKLVPIEPAITCDGSCHVVVWSYTCNCGTPTFNIERSCCGDRWATIATNVTGSSYNDCSSNCGTTRYRITMNCPPTCTCTGSLTYTTADCKTCP